MFQSFVNWASKQTGFSDAWSGGNWRARLGEGSHKMQPLPDFKFIPSDQPVWSGSGELDKLGGGKWRDRLPDLSGTPNLGSPNYPEMGDKGALSWLSDKTTEGLTALSSPGSGIHRLGTNLEASWKGIYEALEYPERTWKQWKRLDLGNYGAPRGSGDSGDGSGSTSGDEGETKPNVYTYNINMGGLDLTEMESEQERADRMRRMLAGRYGRGETNLTGGTGFGTGSQRTLGGYS